MTNDRIQRYTVSGDIAYPIHEDPEGDYVTYEDHVAAIEADRKRGGEPVLDSPAQVGAVRFGQGVPWSTVIEAAQRRYSYESTPEKEEERIKRASEFVKQVQPEAPQPDEPVKVPSDGDIMVEWASTPNTGDMRVDLVVFARALLARYGNQTQEQP